MIYVEMHGRLGNQMFQYAAARALQEKNNQPIMLSFRKVIGANTEGTAGWENSLKYFNVKPCEYYMGKKSLVTEYPVEYRLLCYAYALFQTTRVILDSSHLLQWMHCICC